MNLLINFCLVLFVLVAALMVLVILMQRPKSEGLGAAFGARRHGEHFRRANHERAGEVHHVAGGNIFRAYVCAIGPLCAPQHSQQRLPS